MNINIPFLWAAFVLVTSETTAKAADSFSENFQNTTVTPYLVAPTRYVFGINDTPFGTAQDAVFGTFREYITTAASDYNTVDFVMEITVSVHGPGPSQTAFVGLGSAIPDPNYFTEPHTSIYFRLFPDDFLNGALIWNEKRLLVNLAVNAIAVDFLSESFSANKAKAKTS